MTSKRRIRKRKRVRERDGDRCFYCGLEMHFIVLGRSAKNRATLEHLVDEARGGNNEMDNLKLAHGKCNSRLSERPYDEKMRLRERWLRRNIARGLICASEVIWEVPRPRCYDETLQTDRKASTSSMILATSQS